MAEKNTGNKTNSENTQKRKQVSVATQREAKRRHIWSVVLFAIGILIIVFSIVGKAGAEKPNGADLFHVFLCGVFGLSVYFIGPILIYIAIMLSSNKGKSTLLAKLIQLCVLILLMSAVMQVFFSDASRTPDGFFDTIATAYDTGINLKGGGVLGLILGLPLLLFGTVAARIIIILIAFVFVMLSANITLLDFIGFISIPFKKFGLMIKDKHSQYREDSEFLRQENERLCEDEGLNSEDLNEIEKAERELKKAKSFATIEAAARIEKKQAENKRKTEIKPENQTVAAEELKTYLTDEKAFSELKEENSEIDGPYSPEAERQSRNAVFDAIEAFKTEEKRELEQKIKNEDSVLNLNNSEVISNPRNTAVEAQSAVYAVTEDAYTLPPVLLLDEVMAETSDEDIEAMLKENSEKLVESLKNFGVQTKIVGVSRGPSVTRYELQPATGVKISSITNLTNDISLSLATAGVRIEAPIPNKAAIGIEVPNRKIDVVPFRSMIDSKAFQKEKSKLAVALGKDILGEIIIADIAKMPHMLIAGTTGSGKSVCVNSIIMSILFRATPDEVRLLMIDPKSVEFMIYNGIPHLLIPVVNDAKKAAHALAWAVTEMLNRYKIFADNNVRDLNGYNSLRRANDELEPLPQIVIFIDELSDLMMASPSEVENSICRLAQMARAAGMHLVIATQRPSVNVVTGVIKANIPSRIALKVASQVDSRTILDSAGAEKLLGKGDMLYFPVGMPKPIRVQGCWVSDKEVDRVVEFIKNSFVLKYDEKVIEEIERQAEFSESDKKKPDTSGSGDYVDEKLEEAIEAVIDAGQASTSYLQRKFSLGYGRAAKLIDIMEEMGIVGESKGSKARDVLITKQDWYERKLNKD